MNKRNICFKLQIYVAVFILCSLAVFPAVTVGAEEHGKPGDGTAITEASNLEEFFNEVTELYGKYVLDTSCGDKNFQSGRLLVYSSAPIADAQASEIIGGYADFYVVQYDSGDKAKQAYNRFSGMEGIRSVQPDRLLELEHAAEPVALGRQGREAQVWEAEFRIPADTSVLAQPVRFQKEDLYTWVDITREQKTGFLSWNSSKTGIDKFYSFIHANYTYLPVIKVAVLDTGIDDTLDIFNGRILPGGKNYTSVSLRDQYADDHGHGTMVSSVIADNSFSNVRILPVKVMDRNGNGYDSQIVFGITYAIEYGADIINMSLGAEDADEYYMEIVNRAADRGITVVAAAGNDGKDVEKYSPANIESAVTISSTGKSDQLSKFSNYGNTVDFAVPGEQITVIGRNGISREINGTSFAAPCASAAIALVKSADIRQSGKEIYSLLQQYAVDLGTEGWDTSFGHGLMNLNGLENVYRNAAYITYNLEPGTYEDSAAIAFTSSHKNLELYYTTDGTEPEPDHGNLYAGAIRLERSAALKAAGYVNGERVTEIFNGNYVIHFGKIGNYRIGDVDRDGKITSVDAYFILQYIVGKEIPDQLQQELADTDGDGKMTSLDAWRILKREVSGDMPQKKIK